MLEMKRHMLFLVFALVAAMLSFGGRAAVPPGVLNVAEFVAADGKSDVADALQRVIDGNPNRTLWFPDGVYLISKPVCTPANPERSYLHYLRGGVR